MIDHVDKEGHFLIKPKRTNNKEEVKKNIARESIERQIMTTE